MKLVITLSKGVPNIPNPSDPVEHWKHWAATGSPGSIGRTTRPLPPIGPRRRNDPRFDPNGSESPDHYYSVPGDAEQLFWRESTPSNGFNVTCSPRPIPTPSPPTMTRPVRTPLRRVTMGMRPTATATCLIRSTLPKTSNLTLIIGTFIWVPPWIPICVPGVVRCERR